MTNKNIIKILDKIVNKIRTSDSLSDIESYIEGIKDTIDNDTIEYVNTTGLDKFCKSPYNDDYMKPINHGITWTADNSAAYNIQLSNTDDTSMIPTITTNQVNFENKITPKKA